MKKIAPILAIFILFIFPSNVYAANENASLIEKTTTQTDVTQDASLTEKATVTQTDASAVEIQQYTTGDILIFSAICILCGLICALIFFEQVKFR